MSRRNIEDGYLDANGAERVQFPNLVRYNAFRRQRGRGQLNLSEFEARCGWMSLYRETFDPDEREHVAGLLRQQDTPMLRPGEFEVVASPMPEELRRQLEELGAKWSVGAAPRPVAQKRASDVDPAPAADDFRSFLEEARS